MVGGVMRLGYALILLVGASIMAPMAAASHGASDPLAFALSTDDAPPPVGPGLHVMYRSGHAAPADTFTFFEHPCEVWVSDEPAAVSVDLPAQDVDWSLTFEAPTVIVSVDVTIGKWAGAFAPAGATSSASIPDPASLPGLTQTYEGTFAYAGDSIAPGDRLALRVCITTLKNDASLMATGGTSSTGITFLGGPNPPWPTPELATILLTATGLLAVLGVGLVRRRKL